MQFYFDILSQGTPAQGAALRFQRQPAQAAAWSAATATMPRRRWRPFCPDCGSLRLQVSGGRQFFLESIEIDDQRSPWCSRS